MNNKIKELLVEATENIMGVPIVNQEKFADLVIRETVWKVYNHQTLYHQPDYKFDRLVKDIMEEF